MRRYKSIERARIRVAFKDLIAFLYEKAKENGTVKTQDDFAKTYLVSRETFNQWKSGKQWPTDSTMLQIIKGQGYTLKDCLDAPESIIERESLIAAAETILRRRDDYSRRLQDSIEDTQRHAGEQPVRAGPKKENNSARRSAGGVPGSSEHRPEKVSRAPNRKSFRTIKGVKLYGRIHNSNYRSR